MKGMETKGIIWKMDKSFFFFFNIIALHLCSSGWRSFSKQVKGFHSRFQFVVGNLKIWIVHVFNAVLDNMVSVSHTVSCLLLTFSPLLSQTCNQIICLFIFICLFHSIFNFKHSFVVKIQFNPQTNSVWLQWHS